MSGASRARIALLLALFLAGSASAKARRNASRPRGPARPVAAPAEPAATPAPAPAEEPEPSATPSEITKLREEVATIRARLETRKSEVEGATEEVRRLDLLVELLERERRLADAELASAAIEAEKVTDDLRLAREAKAEAIERLSRRLAMLYRLGNGGPLRLLLSPPTDDRLAAARSIAWLTRRDERVLAELHERERQLEAVERSLERLRGFVRELSARREAKREELREARTRQGLVAAELGREQERDRKRLVELQERAARLERVLKLVEKGRPPSPGDAGKVAAGRLPWPAEGEVLSRFGPQRNPRFPEAFVMNNGIEIGVPAGTSAAAVGPGRVLFAKWLKGYGNMVILDHGDRLLSLYGHLGSVAVQDGQEVKLGEAVGTVGAAAEGETEGLYFEIRNSGKPVDPLTWLKNRS